MTCSAAAGETLGVSRCGPRQPPSGREAPSRCDGTGAARAATRFRHGAACGAPRLPRGPPDAGPARLGRAGRCGETRPSSDGPSSATARGARQETRTARKSRRRVIGPSPHAATPRAARPRGFKRRAKGLQRFRPACSAQWAEGRRCPAWQSAQPNSRPQALRPRLEAGSRNARGRSPAPAARALENPRARPDPIAPRLSKASRRAFLRRLAGLITRRGESEAAPRPIAPGHSSNRPQRRPPPANHGSSILVRDEPAIGQVSIPASPAEWCGEGGHRGGCGAPSKQAKPSAAGRVHASPPQRGGHKLRRRRLIH